MNRFDPTSLEDVNPVSAEDHEWSVEDVVRLEEANEIIVEVIEGDTPGVAEEESGAEAEVRTPKRIVSGRYRSGRQYWQLLLRVDVDGKRPMKRVSGDFYRIAGSTVIYFGSFMVKDLTLHVTTTQVTISGTGTYTFSADCPKLQVAIPRRTTFMPPSAARVQFMSAINKRGAAYDCLFESPNFRTVYYEQDYVTGVKPFTSYNTGSLPSGGPERTLTVSRAYAEAGIEMLNAGTWNEVSIKEAGRDSRWTNAELHAAMEEQFDLWKKEQKEPQWKVWLLAAHRHIDSTLYGIMFDKEGKHRQGCAVFHDTIRGNPDEKLRWQLHTYVHELGHCFNLYHSFLKSSMKPPMPDRPGAASWMNYPGYYRRPDGSIGEAAYWNDFPFQFDKQEIIHLRHAFRNSIIMGGDPFKYGAALEDPQAFADCVEDNSGLTLELEAPRSFTYGEPVVVEIKLRTTDMKGKRVHSQLHPNMGFVQLGIRKPGGQVVVYEPMLEHCVIPDTTTLDADKPAIYDSAYIGYGKDGFYFDQVGFYQVRAIYYALDGSEVLSNLLTLRVRSPLSSDDEDVADLFFGDDQGKLLYLLGSDSRFLKSGSDSFDLVLDKHSTHPMAVYAKMAKGVNLGREFKHFTPDRKFEVRKPNSNESIDLLSAVVDASEKDAGVDNITLNMVMRFLAGVQKSTGDEANAKATVKRMVDIFSKKSFKPHVMKLIKAQAAET